MKQVIIFTLLLSLSVGSFSQAIEPTQPTTKSEYLKKSRTQRTVGFIMLGAGAVTLISISGGNTNLNSVGTLAILGGGLVVGSIPLFIAAGKNKRRYKNATAFFQFEESHSIVQRSIQTKKIPAVALKISL